MNLPTRSIARANRRLALLSAALLVGFSSAVSEATIIGGSVTLGDGTFIELTAPLNNPLGPPNSVGEDTYNLPNLYAFNEDQNIELTADLNVDVGTSPIVATTVVASHYVFYDPADAVLSRIQGTVDFDSEVVGIITSRGNLAASDFLANTGINYLNPIERGLEAGQDFVSISGPQQISVDFRATSPGDYVRVLTLRSPGFIPEPAGLGLVVVAGWLLPVSTRLRRRGL